MSIEVVGLGMDVHALPEYHKTAIAQAQVLVGGKRQLAIFKDHPAEKLLITAPLEPVLEHISRLNTQGRIVVVLADGDPLFFGIGERLLQTFGPDNVHILPNIAVVQTAAARVKAPWHNMATVSLHGRDDMRPLMQALMHNQWVCVLTDKQNTPASTAQWLLDREANWFCIWVCENMGQANEHVACYSLQEAAKRHFSQPNTILLERKGDPEKVLAPGIADGDLASDGTLLTKWPVRAAGLAALHCAHGMTVWDLGAGSGAMGLEASCLVDKGVVWCVERNAERVEHIRTNRRRFGALRVEVLHGIMPTCLDKLPNPDRIFLGGGLGTGEEVLRNACTRLKPGGRVVVHCVLLGSLQRAGAIFEALKWPYEIMQIQSSHTVPLANDLRFTARNPVFIIAAQHPE